MITVRTAPRIASLQKTSQQCSFLLRGYELHGNSVIMKPSWSSLLRSLAIGLIFVAVSALAASRPLPNIVIIFTDDQGYADVGVFGAKGFQTPNLDRLASQGRIFRNFHVAQPVCSASRTALLTGCYPNRLSIHGALGPRSKVGISDA